MKNILLIIVSAFVFRLFLIAGFSAPAADDLISYEDSATIAKGEATFNQNCIGCHNFRQDGIAPQLGGLTTKVAASWIERFIKNPQKIINSGDKRAQQLFEKYKVIMPSFPALKQDELKNIVAYLNTQKTPVLTATKDNALAISNPIPEPITFSGLTVGADVIAVIPASGTKPPLAKITKLDFHPATGNLFVLDMRGKLYELRHNLPSVYMDMQQLKPALTTDPGLGTGFGSFAFHPAFAKNGLIYTAHSEPAGSAKADFSYPDTIKVYQQWVITEWKAENPADTIFTGKGRELFRVNMFKPMHGVQELTFNPLSKPGSEDYGLLYIGVGEGGGVENGYPFIAHTRESIYGTILRIDPRGNNSSNKQYGIPENNPFAQNPNTKILKEIYAIGFRNPHRITWTKAGKMLVSNIGHGNIESVNLVEPGHDYGWPIREGTFVVNPYGNLNKVFPLPANDSIYKFTYPVAQFDHGEGRSITGGYEYTGTAVPPLMGKFLFGDIPSGRLFYFDMADMKQGKQATVKEWKITLNGTAKTLKEVCGSDRADLHFGKDSKGELYLLTKADGKVYKLVSAVMKAPQVQ